MTEYWKPIERLGKMQSVMYSTILIGNLMLNYIFGNHESSRPLQKTEIRQVQPNHNFPEAQIIPYNELKTIRDK